MCMELTQRSMITRAKHLTIDAIPFRVPRRIADYVVYDCLHDILAGYTVPQARL